ncbi:NAD-dependent epimerase/dehydratase family protein [Mesorhizobium sp. CA18]|uniref:NAD-dependent epimerase/dehydratase family protein n=1 Tax=unclassified Mesorhizobium TaxID=325217 RepID=UPI001CCF105C|nr:MULTISPECIES: NAD-dependent epimerase/dehydratase family protein [unclassified Mesorhizobium]MBZ9737143.1 NAD-dependent epimerase/dehydratase family protein [Mesorhizobium sp. CA9]MBZ9826585.1 NAD-dependent epimerase/dehydratase family protein [Mesorhizobium sp. CA18]MBZ9830812.1 NAD-dependent epimerase/dehydratase family protein [Mesorhizobium sp. CA2]MBZ9835512.1 NAD-dependent epimerase/dehydratase family protein [Mesorhizobium sp. CA3]MBZ9875804.1 NAD-dependent epimerase/dehydratase fami
MIGITGANGFIGRAVLRRIGADACVAHVGPIDGEAGGIDICDQPALESLFTGIDTIVHLAGPSAVAASFDAPAAFARAHVLGTATVLAAAERIGVRRFVYVSSAEVYGRPDSAHVPESAPLRPLSPYGAAKAAAEQLVSGTVRRGALDSATIVRPFSIYGPGMRTNGLVGRLAAQARLRQPMRVFSGDTTRDYLHVDDLARGLLMAAARNEPGSLTLNMASGTGIDVAALATLFARIGGGPDALIVEGQGDRSRALDIAHLVADVSLAHETLGWRAEVALADGVRDCLREMA